MSKNDKKLLHEINQHQVKHTENIAQYINMISKENENLQNALKKSEDYIQFATVKASIMESLKKFGGIPDHFV